MAVKVKKIPEKKVGSVEIDRSLLLLPPLAKTLELRPESEEKGLCQILRDGGISGDLNSRAIEDFFSQNPVLHLNTLIRLLRWWEEFKFWERNMDTDLYPHMEMGLHYRNLVDAMEEFVDPMPGQKWLDAACGPAKMSEIIWKKSGKSLNKIIGIDIVLKSAQKRAREIPVLELKYGNLGEDLEIESGLVDGVISNIAIPYVTDFKGAQGKEGMKKVFKELARVLKPGGQLVWSSPCKNMHTEIALLAATPDVIWNMAKIPNLPVIAIKLLRYGKELEKKGREGVYTYLEPTEWDKILEEAGFISRAWKFVFTHQVWVNKSFKAS